MRIFMTLASVACFGVLTEATAVTAATAATAQAASPAASASLKRALVIGNGAYKVGALENARADATLIADTLKRKGFDVTLAKDLTRTGMFDAVRNFASSLPQGASSVVYFAGHGMQIDGQNYLIPVDMVPTSATTVGLKSFPLKVIYEQLSSARSRVNVVILDACRNNPFEPAPAVRMRSMGSMGLAPALAPRGTLIAYSTAPGQQAADGSGRNHSLYSQTLAELLAKDGLPAEEMFKTLADQVRRATLEDQQPWYESSLVGSFYFGAPVAGTTETNERRGAQLALSDKKRSVSVPTAGSKLPVGHVGKAAWYRTMSERDWTDLDNQMQLRAESASADQVPELEAQAKKNNVVAMTTLAMLYRAGTRSGKDLTNGHRYRSDPQLTKAIAWYRKASALGFPVAQAELGEMLYRGRETDINKVEGKRLLEQAALAKYPRATIDLAQLQAESTGSPQDVQALMEVLFGSTKKMQEQYQPKK